MTSTRPQGLEDLPVSLLPEVVLCLALIIIIIHKLISYNTAAHKEVPPLLLANNWVPDVDPSGFWMSEKLDGVRAMWDGKYVLCSLVLMHHIH